MNTPRPLRAQALSILAVTALAAQAAGQADPPPTDISQVILYAIDDGDEIPGGLSDHHSVLMRYDFAAQQQRIMGFVTTEDDLPLEDCESLAWVPGGVHQGMYTVPCRGPLQNTLMRIDPLTATAEPLFALDYHRIVGMVAAPHPDAPNGPWGLLTVNNPAGFNDGPEGAPGDDDDMNDKIFWIDLDAQMATQPLLDFGDGGSPREGLARDPDGNILFVRQDELHRVDDFSTGATTLLNSFGYTNTEGLAFCLGDGTNAMSVPPNGGVEVPAEWTADGILFGFSDTGVGRLLILDPREDGNPDNFGVVEYPVINTPDAEGLVTLTRAQDPIDVVLNGFD